MRSTLFIIILFISNILYGQCYNTSVSSPEGYNVHIEITPISINLSSCAGSTYEYTITLDYSITFTGINIPTSMWTLQGNYDCTEDPGPQRFFDLPNTGGTGTATTSLSGTGVLNCETATLESLGCNNYEVLIGGPGIVSTFFPCGLILPVELQKFTIIKQNSSSIAEWTTLTELDNQGFEIQHSKDSRNWKEIGFIEGTGTTSEEQNYTFTHRDPTEGVNYYRIKQMDYNGTYAYSEIRSVLFQSNTTGLEIYPNPVKDYLTLKGDTALGKKFTIYNTAGQIIKNGTVLRKQIDCSDVSIGLYIVRIETDSGPIVSRFIKE
jgi:hypothetical protein